MLTAKPLLTDLSLPSRVSPDAGARMYILLSRLIRDERGATAIEYGLIAALIAVAAVTVMSTVGTNLKATFSTVASHL